MQLVLLGLVLACPALGWAQTSFAPLGQQYAIAGTLAGDQVFPDVSVQDAGGYVVWQDNFTDGDGLGISAQRLNNSFSGELASFRVNEMGAGDQERPLVALLHDGGAVFVWQGGPPGFQSIYARFLGAEGIFVTGDVRVNASTNANQIAPGVAVLTDGSVVVVWSRYGDGLGMQDVLAQRFTPTGTKLGSEFTVNSYTIQNQRHPAVAPLENGNFVVTWVTEYVSALSISDFNSTNAVTATAQIYCRVFDGSGVPLTSDQRASLAVNPFCSNPRVAGLPGGAFTVVWNQKDLVHKENSWDIYRRLFTAQGVTNGLPLRLNEVTFGDQFAPCLASLGEDQLVVWTSLGQDGSFEGVYGRLLSNGFPSTNEFLVNREVTISKQVHPTVAGDAAGRFLVVWASFGGGAASFDLFAQRYESTRVITAAPAAPYVFALSSSDLAVSWPELAGYPNLLCYELYINSTTPPLQVTSNYFVLSGLPPASAHRFNLAYRFSDGSVSLLSPTSKGTTWGMDGNYDGLPDSWQQMYWGADPRNWRPPGTDSDGDGANDLMEFLSGTHPLDADSVLRTQLTRTPLGTHLSWNCEPGLIYQVQKTVNFGGWVNYGAARFAAGTTDSVAVGSLNGAEFYRVIRVR